MVRFFILFSLLFSIASSNEKESATKIIKAIVKVINTSSQEIWIDSEDQKITQLVNTKKLNFTNNCQDASVVILRKDSVLSDRCKEIPILVLDYNLLNKYDNSVSAFFWKKGRPNIVFLKDRIEKFNINLPLSYKIYEEETIW